MILETFDIPQSESRYLRSPCLLPSMESLELRVIAWESSGERILSFPVDAAGIGNATAHPLQKMIPSLTSSGEITADPHAEQCDADASVQVWIEQDGELHRVRCRFEGRAAVDVFVATGCISCPTVAQTDDGAWVAFHHDIREDSNENDIAKWIALRFVSNDGTVSMLASPLRDLDRDRHGEEQSFEFPSLVVGADGALALFGRGSHNFWRQDVNANGSSERFSLSDGEWGSRGRRVACRTLPDGRVCAAMRERRSIKVHLMTAPQGGRPKLVPATVEVQADASRFHQQLAVVNPAETIGEQIYFGDIQQHSAHSDGVGCAHEVYTRARYRYGDDFVALTDHESFIGKRTSKGEWAFLQSVAEAHQDEGEFATLIAYEWTGKRYPGPGHKCVYLPKPGLDLVSRDEVPSGKELVQRIIELGGIASPHHIGWTGCDEEGHDPVGQPVWEICSCHGCYEHESHPLGARGDLHDQLVDVMLKKGHQFGFTASSDSHGLLWHHGESRKRDPYRTGLTAIVAPALTRANIMDSLRRRRCYATSGAKIKLLFQVDGLLMGSQVPRQLEHHAEVMVSGTAPLARLELISDQGVCWQATGSGIEFREDVQLQAGLSYCYLRVLQEDGEMAWASPVFFD